MWLQPFVSSNASNFLLLISSVLSYSRRFCGWLPISATNFNQRKMTVFPVWKSEFHARFSTHKNRMIVVSARRSDPPFPTSIYVDHLPRFEVALFCITQRRWFRLSPFHGVADRALVINVLSRKSLKAWEEDSNLWSCCFSWTLWEHEGQCDQVLHATASLLPEDTYTGSAVAFLLRYPF